MRMVDIIHKKRNGNALSNEEISFLVKGCTDGSIPDYQLSAWLMAVCFQGMNAIETATLTQEMARSGDMVDLSAIDGLKVDKHSTGGVGDKTTLVVAPIVAACGVKVAKMSGRGLGHTGGTIDKLESIPGFQTSIAGIEFTKIVNDVGLCVVGQSGNLAPADKKLYALRDVTATVDSIPLIAASIMSKKLASGSDCILLDTKTGSGAFMKSLKDSVALAQTMVKIGENSGRRTAALITNMDIPLGYAIGNSLEVIEAVDTLRGKGPKDLTEVCLQLATNMLWLAQKGEPDACRKLAEQALQSGAALEKLAKMVEAQGGKSDVIYDTSLFKKADYSYEVLSTQGGYVTSMETEMCGVASMLLGAGRETQNSILDYSAGVLLSTKTGDYVKTGDLLATFYAENSKLFKGAEQVLRDAFHFSSVPLKEEPLIYARVTINGVEYF